MLEPTSSPAPCSKHDHGPRCTAPKPGVRTETTHAFAPCRAAELAKAEAEERRSQLSVLMETVEVLQVHLE